MRLGVKQVLTVVKIVDFGVYLGSDEERVLLPKKQVPEGIEVGDPIEVFLYKDSSDRMIATTNEPKLTLGELAVLTVADVGRMGAFLDWGLEKDLFLPFKEQTEKVEKGDQCLVSLYIDKSERLCATMKIYHLLRTDSPYKKDDTVRGTIYEVNREIGAFVAVDNLYSALIPKREMYGRMSAGHGGNASSESRIFAVHLSRLPIRRAADPIDSPHNCCRSHRSRHFPQANSSASVPTKENAIITSFLEAQRPESPSEERI